MGSMEPNGSDMPTPVAVSTTYTGLRSMAKGGSGIERMDAAVSEDPVDGKLGDGSQTGVSGEIPTKADIDRSVNSGSKATIAVITGEMLRR